MQRTLEIARGTYKPGAGEPKAWFESMKSLAEVLSEPNQHLLALIEEHQPQSLNELEKLSGRKAANLSRTLRTLESHGLVDLRKRNRRLIPTVRATRFQVDLDVKAAQSVG
ncbi:MAG: MarR family transcriptional regulator [Ectothiorhodospiraceae bacterium]|nr:MarR family transcriptional regulator [Ectothiorhodospiraceae bacterium]